MTTITSMITPENSENNIEPSKVLNKHHGSWFDIKNIFLTDTISSDTNSSNPPLFYSIKTIHTVSQRVTLAHTLHTAVISITKEGRRHLWVSCPYLAVVSVYTYIFQRAGLASFSMTAVVHRLLAW